MPVPQQFGRGDKMGRGPYEKSGMLEDTGLPPGRPVDERFEVLFPTEDVVEGGRTVRKTLEHELEIEVQLWYLPYGVRDVDAFLWRDFRQTVTIRKGGK